MYVKSGSRKKTHHLQTRNIHYFYKKINKGRQQMSAFFMVNLSTQPNALGAVGANASFALSLLGKQGQHFRGKHSIHAPAAFWRGSSGSSLFHGAGVWRLAYGA